MVIEPNLICTLPRRADLTYSTHNKEVGEFKRVYSFAKLWFQEKPH